MKFSTAVVVVLSSTATVSAFQQPAGSSRNTVVPLSMSQSTNDSESSVRVERRSFVEFGAAVMMGSIMGTQPAFAGLLDEYGSDPSKIDAPKKATREAVKVTQKIESDLEPNLRSNYYYPTNKKRYLPRIKNATTSFRMLPL
jgi:hypothetical protein